MAEYPQIVTRIVQDYLDRVKAQAAALPDRERAEFVRELESHIYESYQAQEEGSDLDRILSVLRKLGEPVDVVAGRLPESLVGAGRARRLPFLILAGVLIALFGVPLGFGGVAVLAGILAAVLGLLAGYFATAASMVLVGTLLALLGVLRLYDPLLWEQLLLHDYIHIEGQFAEFLSLLSPSAQGSLFLLMAGIVAATGLGMFWLGRYLLRGLSLLGRLQLDWLRRTAPKVRSWLRRGEAFHSERAVATHLRASTKRP